MSTPAKKPFRKRHLFPRSVEEVIKQATKPLMDKQGKLYGALLSNWELIVGAERASITRPQRLQFPTGDAQGAVLHLEVRPAMAPELAYATDQILEQCARYFGYRAIDRIVLHATHGVFDTKETPEKPVKKSAEKSSEAKPVSDEMQQVLTRMASHFTSGVVKKD